jgi:hypothetical protein
VGGYDSSHEKGANGGMGGLSEQRDRNEVTNSRSESKRNSKVFDIIRELRPKCSSTVIL